MAYKMLERYLIGILSVFSFALFPFHAVAKKTDHYPPFSWDKVPVYAHMGKVSKAFTDQQIEFIASHYDFVTIEKAHALEDYGSSEASIIADARRLKATNPDIRVLFYWNVLLDYPFYDAHHEFRAIPDGALKQLSGDLELKAKRLRKYDLSNPKVRDWWIAVAEDNIAKGNLDGVFIDALPQISIRPQSLIERLGAKKHAELEAGLEQLLKDTQSRLGPDKVLIYNGIRSIPNSAWEQGGLEFLEFTDGVITEHFAEFNSSTPAMMALDIERMQKAAQSGAIVIFKGWPGFHWLDDEMMKQPVENLSTLAANNIAFPLASFLIIAEEHSYFNYTWGYRSHHGGLDWFSEFDQPLGPPLGKATREGWTYSRKFQHASVSLDLENKSAIIDWYSTSKVP